ncbi:MAG TPA: S8 family serine peptidase [Anaerolineae bacterium]|nr:S8 family serine peptidase [Anaerolineae bacterium]HQK13308.1 S8 family serine peptidase [Anaerolineae bacterium]
MAIKVKVWGLIVGIIIAGGVGVAARTEHPPQVHRGITYNALPAAVTPESRATLTQIDGSTLNAVFPDTLRTDIPVELCFNVTVQSPDLEYMDRFTVDLPDTWTVNAVRPGPPGNGHSEEGVEPGNGLYWQTVGYPSSWGAWGNGTYNFCASITVPDCTGSPWDLPWTIVGDQFGASPHTISGTVATRCRAPGLYLKPNSSAVVGCAALTETHSLNLFNYTGADGVFSLSYASTSPEMERNVVISGPISHTLPAGADVDFAVTLLPGACIPAGVDIGALITATGNGYTATTILTTTIGGDSVWADMATGNEPSLYWGHSYYHGGKICFVGGLTGTSSPSPTTVHRCYDIHTHTWSSRAPMPAARFGGAYGLIGNRFYVAGGFDADFTGYRTLYIYDINTNTWSTGANLPTARGGQASGVLRGQLYSAGGSGKNSYPTDCPTYVYNPATNTWTTRAGCPLQDGYGFLLGGSVGSDYHGRLFAGGHYDAYYGWYAYNPGTNVWETLANLPYHRTPLIVEDPRNGRIYALGGLVGWTAQRGGWVYDYATDTWDDSPPDLQTAQGGSLGPRHGSFGDPDTETFWILGGTQGTGAIEPATFARWQDCPFCAQRGWLQGRVFDAETPGRPPVTPAFVFLEPGKVTLPVDAVSGQFGPTELIAWTYTATAYAPGYAAGGADAVAITAGVTHTQEYALFRPSVALTPTALVPLTAYVGRTTPVTLTLANVGHAPLTFRVAESGLPLQGGARSKTGSSPTETGPENKVTVEPQLAAALADDGTIGYLIRFRERPDLTPAYTMTWEARGEFVTQALQATAERAQARVRAYLDARGVPYQAFWIDNVIAVERSNRQIFEGLLRYTEVASLHARRTLGLTEFTTGTPSSGNAAIEPNLTHIRANAVWDRGITGRGIVVANIDTGVRYTHRALVAHYRGTLGNGIFVHDGNWLDASSGKAAPSDDHGHGSHTMGIMIGDDGDENHIGMAPGAQWIACDACNADSGCPDAALLTCAEWVLAPYPMDNPYRRDPDKRPHIVNNSWGDCGRAYDGWFQNVVDAWHAAGIYPVFSNGNASNCNYASPPGLNTVGNPARYGNVTGVGSTGQSDGLYAVHSNWGPTDNPDSLNPRGYANLKPQVVAPGVNIRSSLNSNDTAYASWSGTSMSAPHVAGLIALIWEAGPCLIGDYAATETLIEQTATPIPYATRNGDEGPGNVPNHATGWGEIDALAAVQAAATACDLPWLTAHPLSGTVAGPGTLEVAVTLDCPAPGLYTGTLKVFHNDPAAGTLNVPVQVACHRCTPLTTVDFTWTPLHPETGQEVVFTAVPPTSTAFLPVTYLWQFGDGGTAPGNPVTHTYTQSGVYPVRITAANGCSTVEMTHSLSVTGNPVTPTYGVALWPSMAEASGEPGATIVYTLTVHNTGAVADTFDLSVGGAHWPTRLSATQVNLSAGAVTQIHVNVDIPTDLSLPTDVATITAQSQGNAAVNAASRLRTTTMRQRVYLPLITRGD